MEEKRIKRMRMFALLFRLLLAALAVILFQNYRFALALLCLVLVFADLIRTVSCFDISCCSLAQTSQFWLCCKSGDSIAIHFFAFLTFFTNGGFIYFTDEAIEEYFGGSSNFTEHWVEAGEGRYDYVKLYNANWSYIILY